MPAIGLSQCLQSWQHGKLFFTAHLGPHRGFPGGRGQRVYLPCRRCGFDPQAGTIPWSRRWQPIPYPCLENPVDRGAWRATVHGVTKELKATE